MVNLQKNIESRKSKKKHAVSHTYGKDRTRLCIIREIIIRNAVDGALPFGFFRKYGKDRKYGKYRMVEFQLPHCF